MQWILIGFVGAFWPVWRWYIDRMSDGSDEPLGVLAAGLAGWLMWKTRDEMRLTRPGMVTAIVLGLAYVAGYQLWPPMIRAVLALLILAALCGTLKRHPAVWGLAMLSLPLLASMQFYLGIHLRTIAAVMAQGILAAMGFAVNREGTLLNYRGVIIGVDAPCSGINMLWTGMAFVMGLAAWRGFGWRQTVTCGVCGLVGVIAGNGIRVALLFLKEANVVALPSWTHEGIGILVFGVLVVGLDRWIPRSENRSPDSESFVGAPAGIAHERDAHATGGKHDRGTTVSVVFDRAKLGGICVGMLAVALAPFAPFGPGKAKQEVANSVEFPGWPSHWNGSRLVSLPMSPGETRFAEEFPGRIGVFSVGNDKLILRWVNRPTRKLHSSADCLRAAGYEVRLEGRGEFVALKSGDYYRVEEGVFEADSPGPAKWREVSAWFWSAFTGKSKGPWWAATIISAE